MNFKVIMTAYVFVQLCAGCISSPMRPPERPAINYSPDQIAYMQYQIGSISQRVESIERRFAVGPPK